MLDSSVPSSQPRGASKARLWPREHGAYAQLAFPLLSALVLAHRNAAVVGLTLAIVTTFLAHEPLLILLGHRGMRARTQWSVAAQRRLMLLGTLAALGGVTGVALADDRARLSLVVPALLGIGTAVLVALKREKSTAGEIWVTGALSFVALPVALAGDVAPQKALELCSIWTALFAASTLAVRTVIASTRKESTLLLRVLGVACAAAVPLVIALRASAHPALLLTGVAPVCAIALTLCLRPIHARYLRQVGWAVAGTCTWSFVWVLLGLR